MEREMDDLEKFEQIKNRRGARRQAEINHKKRPQLGERVHNPKDAYKRKGKHFRAYKDQEFLDEGDE